MTSEGADDPAQPFRNHGSPPIIPPPLPGSAGQKKQRQGRLLLVLGICAVGLAVALTVGPALKRGGSGVQFALLSGDGVKHTSDTIDKVPWSIQVVKIDRSRKDLTFVTPHAGKTILGVSKISQQAKAIPAEIGAALAGVNGDFYERDNPTYAGDPRGLQILNGELVSAPSTVCVWFDATGNPHLQDVKGDFKITWPDGQTTRFGLNQQRRPNGAVLYTPAYGASTHVNGGRDLVLEPDEKSPWLPLKVDQTYRARVREIKPSSNAQIPAEGMLLSLGSSIATNLATLTAGSVIEISTATTPDLQEAKWAVAGGPALIQNGTPFSQTTPPANGGEGYSEHSKYERHPRSAVGWNATHVYLVTVDGRQPGFSVGMTLAELAAYMVKLGCTEGMNFDGGASACMWMSGQIVNNPCQGERPIANSLFVVRKPKP